MLKATLFLLPVMLLTSQLRAEATSQEKPPSQIGKYQICVVTGSVPATHTLLFLDTETGKMWKRDHSAWGYYEWETLPSPVTSEQ